MEQWYALHAKPHKERQVAENLRQHNLEVFLPLVRVNPVNPRAARKRPYFPCYLFVKADLQAIGLGALQWTPGLRRVVEFDGQPAIVPERFMKELKRRLGEIQAAGGLALDGLDRGDSVRIVAGPFAGYEAVFDFRLPGNERVRVLLELLAHSQGRGPKRRVPVELNAGSIEKVRSRR
jgi:transcription elongation factor/antiterminator RfaH